MRKIVIFITDLAYGGAEAQVVNLALKMRERHLEVHLITIKNPQAYLDRLISSGVEVTTLRMNNKIPNPIPIIKLIYLLRKMKPDIIHSHMVHANILIRLIRPFLPKPKLICTAHSIDETSGKKFGILRELIYRITDALCDMTTQVSQAGYERYVYKKLAKINKIMYIPNGIDTNVFKPDIHLRQVLRSEMGLGNKFVWVAVGRLEPPKDYFNMINAFSNVVKQFEHTILFIIGDGTLKDSILEEIDKLKLNKYVRLLGIRKDVMRLLNIADGFVLSSSREGLPLVLLEAASIGVPMVVTDVGGNKEIVHESKSGYLVPPKSSNSLSEKMLLLMSKSELERKIMGEYARKLIKEKYDINIIVDKWIHLYKFLLKS